MANNLARLFPLIKNVDPPIFKGANDMLPFDYLEELTTYQVLHGASDIEMLTQVIPWSLREYAYQWLKLQFKFCPFNGMVDFKRRFRGAFETHEYRVRLKDYFDKRTQDWNETLVAYIVAINDLYERLGETPTQKEMVQTILSRINPYYSPYFAKREKLNTVYELYVEAEKVDLILAEMRMYRPPPKTGIEPSLLPQENFVNITRSEHKLKSSLKNRSTQFKTDLGTQTSIERNSVGSVSTQSLAVVAAQKENSTQTNSESKPSITTEQFTQTELVKAQEDTVIGSNLISSSHLKANVSKSHLALSADCFLNAEKSDSGFDSFSDSNSDISSNAYSTSALVLEHPLSRKELSMSKLAKSHRRYRKNLQIRKSSNFLHEKRFVSYLSIQV